MALIAGNWRGGLTEINKRMRGYDECQQWRKSVFERDNYTCQFCNVRGGSLEADHINGWAYYPQLRFELSNGRTLCKDCHKKTDNYGGKGMRNKHA